MGVRKSEILIVGIALLSFVIGVYYYPQMPEKMASHWNAQGRVDDYLSKFWGVFLIPITLVPLALLFMAIPRIDPLRENIEKFRRYYDGFVILFMIFMIFVYLQMILWNIGIQMSPNVSVPIGVGLLFIGAGILCENAKRNWFIGIRTPWTLSSERVWDKTHRMGGKLFKIAGVMAMVGIFFQSYAAFFVLIPVLLVAAYTVVYSYFEYQKEMK
ncbi:MAG: SdpI family protein [Anaerolineae bacterium]